MLVPFRFNNDHLDFRLTSGGLFGGCGLWMTGVCMLERDSSGSLSSLLSLCRESFVAELSVRGVS
jgi:hypothetical protein